MRRERSYLAHEERKVIPCTWGKVIPWRCGQEDILAQEKRRSYLGDVDRKEIPCTWGVQVIPWTWGEEGHTLHMRRGRSWSRKDSRRRETWQSAHQLFSSVPSLQIFYFSIYLQFADSYQTKPRFKKAELGSSADRTQKFDFAPPGEQPSRRKPSLS